MASVSLKMAQNWNMISYTEGFGVRICIMVKERYNIKIAQSTKVCFTKANYMEKDK